MSKVNKTPQRDTVTDVIGTDLQSQGNGYAKSLGLKPKTKAYLDTLLNDPTITQSQAYIDTHKTNSVKTARVESTNLLKKPSARIYMMRVETDAKRRVAELINSEKQDIALKASQDVLDRNIGKAVQRQETASVNLNLNLEPSKELADQFTQFITQQTKAN